MCVYCQNTCRVRPVFDSYLGLGADVIGLYRKVAVFTEVDCNVLVLC